MLRPVTVPGTLPWPKADFAERPIGPRLDRKWPEDYAAPLYWTARKSWLISGQPQLAELLVAEDRHFEIYINQQLVARQRNFYNGDVFIPAWHWSGKLASILHPGINTIDFIVRSDPWRNKNHRCLEPFLLACLRLDANSGSQALVSDTSWEVACLDGWRQMINLGCCGTIHFEKITLPPAEQAILAGFARPGRYVAAAEPDFASRLLPPVFLCPDQPLRQCRLPISQPISCGDCRHFTQALQIRPPAEYADGAYVLTARFQEPAARQIGLATSEPYRHRVICNGEPVVDRQNAPDVRSMSYLRPAGSCQTRSGDNNLEIHLFRHEHLLGDKRFRLAVPDVPALADPRAWTDLDGKSPDIQVVGLSVSESMAALQCSGQNSRIRIDQPAGVRLLPGTADAYAVFDLQRVVNGHVALRLQADTPGRVILVYGFKQDHGVLDCERDGLRAADVLDIAAGASWYRSFDCRVFRYLQLVFCDFAGAVSVTGLQVTEDQYVDPANSSFKTADTQIDRLWQAAGQNLSLCCDELMIDNPDREHTQWLDGVIYISTAGYYAHGDLVARRTSRILQEFMLAQQPDGQMPAYSPGAWFPRLPLQCHMSMFVMSCHEHYLYTGDERTARLALDPIRKMIEHWERYRVRGLLTDLHTVFVDWGSHIYSYGKMPMNPANIDLDSIRTGPLTTMNAYYLGDLVLTARTMRFLGLDHEAAELEQLAADLRRAMHDRLYDEQLGLFRDGCDGTEAAGNLSQTANALAVLFGAAPQGQEAAIMRRLFDPEIAARAIPANSFFAWQFGSALFQSGCGDLAIRWLRETFGPMLDNGPGTLWERVDGYASYVQSSGAALIWLFARYLAGIWPAEPGFRRIGISPCASGLSHLDATFSLPAGKIGAAWRQTADGLVYDLYLPPDMQQRPCCATGVLELRRHVWSDQRI